MGKRQPSKHRHRVRTAYVMKYRTHTQTHTLTPMHIECKQPIGAYHSSSQLIALIKQFRSGMNDCEQGIIKQIYPRSSSFSHSIAQRLLLNASACV